MKALRQTVLSYLPLAFLLFNALFLLQILFGYFPSITSVEQWVVIFGNFLLFGIALFVLERRRPKHFSKYDLTLFQILFFLLMLAHGVLLLILIISKPILFLIFMPFEFFVIAFHVGFYFLLTRYIFPIKRTLL